MKNINNYASDSAFNHAVNASDSQDTEGAAPADNGLENKEDKGELPKDEGKSALSESEAKLLKEVMKYKEERNKSRDEASKLSEQLKKFDGINLEEVTKLIKQQKDNEKKELESKGEYQRIIEQNNKEWEDKYGKTVSELQAEINSLKSEIDNTKKQNLEKDKNNKFANSTFVRNELIVSGSKVERLYGSHFEYNEDGELIAYDKPAGYSDRTPIVNAQGKPASFEESLEKIIKADADSQPLFKSKVKSGANSKTDTLPAANKSKDEMTRDEKIAEGLKQQFPELDLSIFKN